MWQALQAFLGWVRKVLGNSAAFATGLARRAGATLLRTRALLVAALLLGGSAWFFWSHPPLATVGHGEIGVRANRLTGTTTVVRDGLVVDVPGLHELRRYPTIDQVYRPGRGKVGQAAMPFQSVEGLSFGVDLVVRYAIDPKHVSEIANALPGDLADEIVAPEVEGVVYKVFARYTIREIYSSKRTEIQEAIETDLRERLAHQGLTLRDVQMGKVDLPTDYRVGMEKLLAEELESEKMRFTLELKEKQVQETALEGQADQVRREKAAEAAANEQIIAARAQEESMKHVLPFKQKQIEQRQLEAEAEKVARIKSAEGTAQARVIEAQGEADSRHKLADAEAYRLEQVGRVASAQLERDGELITKHPLLIQKTLADKLSDKISVIIAPPPHDGGFIGASLLGTPQGTSDTVAKAPAEDNGAEN